MHSKSHALLALVLAQSPSREVGRNGSKYLSSVCSLMKPHRVAPAARLETLKLETFESGVRPYFLLHLTPSFVCSIRMPAEVSSARIASDSGKFLAARAAFIFAILSSICGSDNSAAR